MESTTSGPSRWVSQPTTMARGGPASVMSAHTRTHTHTRGRVVGDSDTETSDLSVSGHPCHLVAPDIWKGNILWLMIFGRIIMAHNYGSIMAHDIWKDNIKSMLNGCHDCWTYKAIKFAFNE